MTEILKQLKDNMKRLTYFVFCALVVIGGCKKSKEAGESTVIVDFSASAVSTYVGGTVSFEDQSEGDAIRWKWTFNGGKPGVSEEKNPQVVYERSGRHSVTLEVFDKFGSSTKTIEGYIMVIPGNGLVAYYPFDGTIDDVGTQAHDLAKFGETSFDRDRRNTDNSALSLRGDNYLSLDHREDFDFENKDFTVSCWINASLPTDHHMMVWSKGSNQSGQHISWLRLYSDTRYRFAVQDNSGGNTLRVPPSITGGNWTHVVCIRQGLSSRVYLDGALAAESSANSIKNVSNEHPFFIGVEFKNVDGEVTYLNHFTGQIDDFVIYDRALTEVEILALFNL